ncbi:MAG: bile acid:sodium symporter family protein [Verrucomicrobia bacterium]|nr:bile acid:sodium symporter family protein [Verrucomicrobiota bacterium]
MITSLLEHYPKYHHLVASTQLVLAMLGMGMVMRPRDFIELVLEPKPMVVGALYQLIGIPLLTVLMIFFIKLPPEIVVGFFMLAAMPGGSMSNIYTHLGKGNAALSVALTGLMTLLALFTAPLILKIFASEYIPADIEMPAGVIMREIFLYLLLPLVVGMGLGRIVGTKKAHLISIWTVRGSLIALSVLVVGSLGSGQIDVGSYGYRVPIVVFLYCLIIQIVVLRGSFYVLKFSRRDSTTLGIESSMKNVNLSLLIAASFFKLDGPNAEFGGGVLFVLLLYGGVSLFVSAVPAFANYRHMKKQGRLAEVDVRQNS